MTDASQKILAEAIGALSAGVPEENAFAIREIVETVYRAGGRDADASLVEANDQLFDHGKSMFADREHLRNINADLLAVLIRVQRFLSNGIALGFIRMPDADVPDPAKDVPGIVDAAIARAKSKP